MTVYPTITFRSYPVQNGYLNDQWTDEAGYHDNVTYDSRDETLYDDQRRDDSRHVDDERRENTMHFDNERTEDKKQLPEQEKIPEDSKETFASKEPEKEAEQPPQNDLFDSFKTGPFPKKYTMSVFFEAFCTQ